MRGENDSSEPTYGAYESPERNFVKALRAAFAYYGDPASTIGFVDAGISDCPAWTQYQSVNDAKRKLASEDEFHSYFDTVEAGWKYNAEPVGNPDIYHYDSASEIKLEHLFAQVLLEKYLEI